MGRYRTIYLNTSKNGWPSALAFRRMLALVLGLLFCDFPVLGQSQPSLIDRGPGLGSPRATELDRTGRQDSAEQQLMGTINGTVVDRTGGIVTGARVKLSGGRGAAREDVISEADGR